MDNALLQLTDLGSLPLCIIVFDYDAIATARTLWPFLQPQLPSVLVV